jgi:hypothetical protein
VRFQISCVERRSGAALRRGLRARPPPNPGHRGVTFVNGTNSDICIWWTHEITLPEVTVTAPAAPPPAPPYLRNPWKSYERNPYGGRNRVEEDQFVRVSCAQTRIAAAGSNGTCLWGYQLPGPRVGAGCDLALDVVMFKIDGLSIEADATIFDPYKGDGCARCRRVAREWLLC